MSGASIKPGVKSDKQAAAEQSRAVSAELPPSLRSTFNDVFKLVEEKCVRAAGARGCGLRAGWRATRDGRPPRFLRPRLFSFL
jgi:hypothetical protein